jgi:uncharacterized cupin superfamily protein
MAAGVRVTSPQETTELAEPLHQPNGDQVGDLAVVSDPAKGAPVWAGVWTCGQQEWTSPFDVDETFHVVSGQLRITADGETHELTAGTTAFFPKGLDAHWTVVEPFTAFVVIT